MANPPPDKSTTIQSRLCCQDVNFNLGSLILNLGKPIFEPKIHFSTCQNLECPKSEPQSLFYDSLRYLSPFRLGGAIHTAEEDNT